ncbi:Cholecystokinin receptor type A [Toxocara canis]|uniref:Cholecystokinin receptor type A n=1 Tax=Toxocara canis TaxID=6265 RepID=A0A0B2VDU6_TOXCA|nr:Cholecystokinin receptor type A [Toxocara canis]
MSVLYGNVIFTLKTGIRFDVNLAVSMNSFDCGNNIYGTRFRRQLDGRRSTSSWLFDAMFFPTWATKPFTDMNSNGVSSLKTSPGFSLSRSRTAPFAVPTSRSFHSKRLMSVFSTSSASILCNSHRRSGEVDSSYLLRSTHQEKILIAKKRVTRMLIMLVIAYVVCWTPSFIWWLLIKTTDLVDAPSVWNNSLNTIITVLTYISTCTNPITYCFMNASFRKSVFSHCFCCPNAYCRQHTNQQVMTYPQRRRTQSATPRLNSANENDDIAEEGCNVVAGAANGNKPVPEIEIQFFGNGGTVEAVGNDSLKISRRLSNTE